MTNTVPVSRPAYYRRSTPPHDLEDDLKPYASLFLKPLTSKKSAFTKQELEVMCRDPRHSPRLIMYLINFFKHM